VLFIIVLSSLRSDIVFVILINFKTHIVGNDGEFQYKLIGEEKINTTILKSGDLIVFGGAQRNIVHRVSNVFLNSNEIEDCNNCRINLTFRTCTGFTKKDEADFKTEEYLKRTKNNYINSNKTQTETEKL
jgi:hypothetical protein